MRRNRQSLCLSFLVASSVLLLSACGSIPDAMPGLDKNVPFSPDDFDNSGMHTRHIAASQAKTCEAARRALLSQGYLVNTATAELVEGRKFFQPSNDIHYVVEMRVVCAPEGQNDDRTAAYASAVQDRYVIKKINNSASLGVGALGSVSLPVSATDDTLVKVGSETVSDTRFYQRFFQLFDTYVPTSTKRRTSIIPDKFKPGAQATPAEVPAAAPAEPVQSAQQVESKPVATPHVEPGSEANIAPIE